MKPSFSSVGKTVRMEHIFKGGSAIMVAMNHGIAMGACGGITYPGDFLELIKGEPVDAITMHKGMAVRNMDSFAGRAALVLKSTNSTESFHPDETQVASVTDALTLGADAIAVGLSLYDPFERQAIEYTGKMVEAADRAGLPTVAHSYPCGPLISDSERFTLKRVSYAVRVAYELGIDIIKSYWTGSGSTFEKIVRIGHPAKVVISGGPKCHTLRECYEMTYEGIRVGADGITYGRNIWEHEYPAAVIRGLHEIVHKGEGVDKAMQAAMDAAGTHLE